MNEITSVQSDLAQPRIVRVMADQAASPVASSAASSMQDRVEISPAGRTLSELANVPGIRAEKVARVRASIERGDYLTSDKINKTIDRMLVDLND